MADYDPYWDNVESLLHFDDDESCEKGMIWTPYGNPVFAAGQLNTVAGGYLKTPSDTAWEIGTDDFTIEFTVIDPQNTGGYANYFDFRTTDPACRGFAINGSSGGGVLQVWDWTDAQLTGSTLVHNQIGEFKIALVRSAGVVTLYVNGVSNGSFPWTYHINPTGDGYGTLGATHTGIQPTPAKWDEFRFTRGVARYTEDYTPHEGRFPGAFVPDMDGPIDMDFSSVLALLHFEGPESSPHIVDSVPDNDWVVEAGAAITGGGADLRLGSCLGLTANFALARWQNPPAELDLTKEFTIELRVRPTSSPTVGAILHLYDSGGHHGIHIWRNPAGMVSIDNGLVGAPVLGAIHVPEDEWTTIRVTRQVDTLYSYINEVEDVVMAVQPYPSVLAGGVLGVFNNGFSSNHNFDGQIDEVRISRMYRTAPEEEEAEEVVSTDPYFYDVVSLARFDVDGSDIVCTDDWQFIGGASLSAPGVYADGQSVALSGAAQYVTLDVPDFINNTGNDFTVEFHFRIDAMGAYNALWHIGNLTGTGRYQLDVRANGGVALYADDGIPLVNDISAAGSVVVNQWTHIALVQHGLELRVYLDGVLNLSSTLTRHWVAPVDALCMLGAGQIITALDTLNGRIDEPRVTMTARYAADFIPPTGPYPDSAGDPYFDKVVSLLYFDEPTGSTAVDDKIEDVGWTLAGGAVVNDDVSGYGGTSLYAALDSGTTKSTSLPAVGTADFTVEGSFLGGAAAVNRIIFDARSSEFDSNGFVIYIGTTGTVKLFFVGADQILGTIPITGTALWHRWAVSRVDGVAYLHVDGVEDGSIACTANFIAPTLGYSIGNGYNPSADAAGYIDMFRFTIGVGRYTIDYTPPPNPFPTTKEIDPLWDEVVSLVHFDVVNDDEIGADWTNTGGVTVTKTNARHGSSGLFGASKYLSKDDPSFEITTGDFTVELSFRADAVTAQQGLWFLGTFGSDTNRAQLYIQDSTLRFYWHKGGADLTMISPATLSAGTWHKASITLIGDDLVLRLDGVTAATTTTTASGAAGGHTYLGYCRGASTSKFFTGLIDEYRFTNLTGRYPADYTPAIGPFPNAVPLTSTGTDPYYEHVESLLHFDVDFTDETGLVYTVEGDAAVVNGVAVFPGSAQSLLRSSFDIGTDDFTIEGVINGSQADFLGFVFDSRGSNGPWLYFDANESTLNYVIQTGSVLNWRGTTNVCDGADHTFAISRVSGYTYYLIDGIVEVEGADANDYQMGSWRWGNGDNGGYPLKDKTLDNLRITLGVGRYEGPYTPNYGPWPTVAETLLPFPDQGPIYAAWAQSTRVGCVVTEDNRTVTDASTGNTYAEGDQLFTVDDMVSFEFTCTAQGSPGDFMVGFVTGTDLTTSNQADWWRARSDGIAYLGGQTESMGNNVGPGDVITICLDQRDMWIAVNGVWAQSGDPEAGTNPIATLSGFTTSDLRLSWWSDNNANLPAGTVNTGQDTFLYMPSRFAAGMQKPRALKADGDPYWDAVDMLLHFNRGPTVLDVKGTPWELHNAPVISGDNPRFGGGSLNLVGADQFVNVDGDVNDYVWLHDGRTDFTVELEWYANVNNAWSVLFTTGGESTSNYGFGISAAADGRWDVTVSNGTGTFVARIQAGTYNAQQWYHVAVTLLGDLLTLWVDGAEIGTATLLNPVGNIPWFTPLIGRYIGSPVGAANGDIDEVRVTKGVARYTKPFNRPTAPHPEYPSLLGDPLWDDVAFLSVFDEPLENAVGPQQVTINPPAELVSNFITFGESSLYSPTDGAVTKFSIQQLIDMQWGKGDFCFETWYYPSGQAGASNRIFQARDGDVISGFYVAHVSAYVIQYSVDNFTTFSSDIVLTANRWNFLVIERVAGVVTGYLNGNLVSPPATVAADLTLVGAYEGVIGGQSGNRANRGWIDDMRFTSAARYRGSHVPPIRQMPSFVQETPEPVPGGDPYFDDVILLLQGDGEDGSTTIVDSSNDDRTLTAMGGAEIGTTVVNAGTGSIWQPTSVNSWINHDGPLLALTSSPSYTFEAFVYLSNLKEVSVMSQFYYDGGFNGRFTLDLNFGKLKIFHGQAAGYESTVVLSTEEWHHIAVVYDADEGEFRGYQNGVNVFTGDASNVSGFYNTTFRTGCKTGPGNAVSNFFEGAYEVRVTQLVRYTADFTPPEAFPDDDGGVIPGGDPHFDYVVHLLHLDGDATDETGAVWTTYGTAVPTVDSKYGSHAFEVTGGNANSNGGGIYEPTNSGLGAGDLTVEFYGAWDATKNDYRIIAGNQSGAVTGSTWLVDIPLNGSTVQWMIGGTAYSATTVADVMDGVYRHYAWSRVNGVSRWFIDGVQQSGDIPDTNNYIAHPTFGIVFGANPNSPNLAYTMEGRIDEIRVTVGVGRYEADFTPPTEPFPDSAGGVIPPEPEIFPPTITTQPFPQSGPQYGQASFTTAATGDGGNPVSYEWFLTPGDVSQGTGTDLVLTNLDMAQDQTQYYCRVTDDTHGRFTDTNTVILTVIAAEGIVITAQPQPIYVLDGAVDGFTVAATGVAVLTYQWKVDGVDIPGETGAVLSATFTAADAGKIYTVEITDGNAQTLLSDGAVVTVVSPPSFISHPASGAAIEYRPWTMSVQVAGNSPFTYVWYENGSPIPDSDDSVLVRDGDMAFDLAEYDVIVTDTYGHATQSDIATMDIEPSQCPDTGEFMDSDIFGPADTSIPFGQGAQFTITISAGNSNPPYTIQWYSVEDGIIDGVANESAITETLIITPAIDDQGKRYYAVVHDSSLGPICGQSRAASLDLRPPELYLAWSVEDTSIVRNIFNSTILAWSVDEGREDGWSCPVRTHRGLTDDNETYWIPFYDKSARCSRGPLVNDKYNRYYWTQDGQNAKYAPLSTLQLDTTTRGYDLGVPTPLDSPVVMPAAAEDSIERDLIVDRAYVYTYVTIYGEEGPPSPATIKSGYDGGAWELSRLSDPLTDRDILITRKRIYRSISSAGDAEFHFVADISVAADVYTDVISTDEVSRNYTLESETWLAPPDGLEGLIAHPNGFFVGFVGRDLYFSEPYRPHAWPQDYVVSAIGDIVGLGVFGTTIVVATNSHPYFVTGTHPAGMVLTKHDTAEPCIARYGIVSMPFGVYYPGPNGLMLGSPRGLENATQQLMTKEEWQNRYQVTEFDAARYQSQYVAFYNKTEGLMFAPDEPFAALVDLTLTGVDYEPDQMQTIFTDEYSGKTYLIEDCNMYEWNPVAGAPLDTDWTSMEFDVPDPVNFGAGRIISYAPYTPPTMEEAWAWYIWNAARLAEPLNPFNFAALNMVRVVDGLVFDYDVLPPEIDQAKVAELCENHPQMKQAFHWGPEVWVPVYGQPPVAYDWPYTPYVIFEVMANETVVYSKEITHTKMFRLPHGFKATRFRFRLRTNIHIQSVKVAETGKELSRV